MLVTKSGEVDKRSLRTHRFSEDRFWSRVSKEGHNGCWIWTGCLGGNGYPYQRMNGKSQLSYRVSWFLVTGEWPVMADLCHKCDTPACVNPSHLFMGTAKDNLADMRAKNRHGSFGRSDWSSWMKGEKNHKAKFSESEIASIRSEFAEGRPKSHIAKDRGVWPSTIDRIVTGKTWKESTCG